MTDLPKEKEEESLVTLAAPPLVWGAHFLLSYATAAVYCAKLAGPDGSLAPARAAIAGYTTIALAILAVLGLRGYRRHRARATPDESADAGSPLARQRFLGFATLLLAGLAAVAVVYAALVVVVLRSCG